MDKGILSSLNFENYACEKIEFHLNEDFVSGREVELDLSFERTIEIDIEDSEAIIRLGCKVFENYKEKNYPFFMNVLMSGFFYFESTLDEKDAKQLLEVNGTAILFPYLRALISNITSSAGVHPLVIPTINIVNMIRNENCKQEYDE